MSKRKSDFLNYVKDVVKSEFQCELKPDMGEGKALIISASDKDEVTTYINGGFDEVAGVIAHIFNSLSESIEKDFGKDATNAKNKFVGEMLSELNDDWLEAFMLLLKMKKEKNE